MKKVIIIFSICLMVAILSIFLYPTSKESQIEDKNEINIPEYRTHQGQKMPHICYWEFYEIRYVDKFNYEVLNNCYAFKNINFNQVIIEEINKSLEYAGINEYFIDDLGWDCDEIRTQGHIYCLRDKSECLEIDGRICNLINMTGIKQ